MFHVGGLSSPKPPVATGLPQTTVILSSTAVSIVFSVFADNTANWLAYSRRPKPLIKYDAFKYM